MKFLKTLLLLLVAVSVLKSQDTKQGKLINFELVRTYTKADLEKRWKEAGIPKAIAPIQYDVEIYEFIYNTCWHDSSCIKASGLYFVPKNAKNSPLMVYHHGTQIEKHREVGLGGEMAICIGFATDGFAVAYSDYVGLGKGEKFHLYHHVYTEAFASIDLVRAVREFNTKHNISLSEHLFTTGYSQGGHATMAFQKVVEADSNLSKEFKFTASAPMSGAYDLTGVQEANMFKEYSHPGYLPYLMVSFQEVYKLYDDLKTAFKTPYDTKVLSLFNGQYSMGDVNRQMPRIPKDAIKNEVIDEYLNNEAFPFKVALRENSTHNWVPKTPMLLCYCEADEQVDYKNSIVARDSMQELGARNISLRRVSKHMDHGTCALYAVLYTKMYFESFIKGSKKGRKGPVFKRMLISLAIGQHVKKDKKKFKNAKNKQR
jgi:acetyl esterase/lipase